MNRLITMTLASPAVDLSVLIVSFNTRALLIECLESVFAEAPRCGGRVEVIVVDNNSSDGSADAVVARYPEVRLARLERNIGFAAANNLGVRLAGGEVILLLNPDTRLMPGAIEHAFAFARKRPEAIVGGRTFFGDGRLNPTSCHGWPTLWGVTCQAIGLSALFRRSRLFNPESLGSWNRDTVRAVPVVTGCFMLLHRTTWDSLGGFDEAFFMYGEETDFCMRAARKGIPRLICPQATLVHHGGASEPARADKMVRLFRAKGMLYRKHWSRLAAAYGIAALQVWALTRVIGHWFLARIGSKRGGLDAWSSVWRRRSEYAAPRCSARPVEN